MSALADTIRITGGRSLVGHLRTPGDKSISHRALLLGALAEGRTLVRGLSDGADVAASAAAVAAMGAAVATEAGEVRIDGGRARLHETGPIDCANSGTSMRLLAGLCAPLPWDTTLWGDESLSARPMDRIAEPLGAMGAVVEGRGERRLPPLVVHGGPLRGIDWTPPMASAQVKSAILLAGLDAAGETVVREPVPTRAHTEEMLLAAGADLVVEPWEGGRCVRLRRSSLRPLDIDVPGDPSQAAFWLVGACVVAGSGVVVERVYAGAERIGFLRVLERMGAAVQLGEGADADMAARWGELTATAVGAAEIPSLDEVPILAVAAVAATGTTTFSDVGELTVKESDRLAATAALVGALGGSARVRGETLEVEGSGGIGPAPVVFDSRGDHRLAMAAVLGALASPGGGVISGMGSVATSYPAFLDHLTLLAPGCWEPAAESA